MFVAVRVNDWMKFNQIILFFLFCRIFIAFFISVVVNGHVQKSNVTDTLARWVGKQFAIN